jgi:hypothetical protein
MQAGGAAGLGTRHRWARVGTIPRSPRRVASWVTAELGLAREAINAAISSKAMLR